mmetsp:Transcript_83577/g.233293  ORF Transcript_83577/g.233293 Transcript_83577/m.233293 type:complete len:291 (-) Transcript_83577:260-1132(-)
MLAVLLAVFLLFAALALATVLLLATSAVPRMRSVRMPCGRGPPIGVVLRFLALLLLLLLLRRVLLAVLHDLLLLGLVFLLLLRFRRRCRLALPCLPTARAIECAPVVGVFLEMPGGATLRAAPLRHSRLLGDLVHSTVAAPLLPLLQLALRALPTLLERLLQVLEQGRVPWSVGSQGILGVLWGDEDLGLPQGLYELLVGCVALDRPVSWIPLHPRAGNLLVRRVARHGAELLTPAVHELVPVVVLQELLGVLERGEVEVAAGIPRGLLLAFVTLARLKAAPDDVLQVSL